MHPVRTALPHPTDRLRLGASGLAVSPICIGITEEPGTVLEAFDAGINFFFVSADLHWPLYDGVRRGLQELLSRGPSIRDEIVVGVVSYLDEPLFQALQFHEVLNTIPGLGRVDVLIAGAVPNETNFNARFGSIQRARAVGHSGSRAIGASFHHRRSALLSLNHNCLDVSYVRYNTAHPGAGYDTFPYIRPDRTSLIFNFKSLISYVTPEVFHALGLNGNHWLPKVTDYYRFVLSHPSIDGILCSPASPAQLREMLDALEERPLTPFEEQYMIWLSSVASPKFFE